ncbi:hypothetical protein NMY22_g11308 [Coprinellus aureogranulatus]|nr:hypothetical protein NMY22_g11308 [Coprinellus aureogranulatus]
MKPQDVHRSETTSVARAPRRLRREARLGPDDLLEPRRREWLWKRRTTEKERLEKKVAKLRTRVLELLKALRQRDRQLRSALEEKEEAIARVEAIEQRLESEEDNMEMEMEVEFFLG